jgi:hypothetical protein
MDGIYPTTGENEYLYACIMLLLFVNMHKAVISAFDLMREGMLIRGRKE